MEAPKRDFIHSDAPEPHRARTKALLRAHPEIRTLIGPNPTTFLWISGIVALQIAIAFLVRDERGGVKLNDEVKPDVELQETVPV
jgi:sphingolipid delta-4 desaturase